MPNYVGRRVICQSCITTESPNNISIQVFMSRLRKIQNLELDIAKSKNKLLFYTAKRGKFDL